MAPLPGFGAGFVWVPCGRGPVASNLLVVLHGLGDTEAPFARLVTTMALPQTADIVEAARKVCYREDAQ